MVKKLTTELASAACYSCVFTLLLTLFFLSQSPISHLAEKDLMISLLGSALCQGMSYQKVKIPVMPLFYDK